MEMPYQIKSNQIKSLIIHEDYWAPSEVNSFKTAQKVLKTTANYSGIFYSCQFIKSFRPFHSFWEEEDLPWEINASFTEWHHYHIMGIQFQGHPANSAVAYL